MIYALMGLLGFGLADFFVVYLARSAGYLKGILWNTLFMFLYLVGLLYIFRSQANIFGIGITEFITSCIAGLISTLGGLSFYKGTQRGNLSVLSPIASSYSVIVVIFSVVFLSQVLSLVQTISILFVVVGTILVSTNLKYIKNLKLAVTDKAVPYGLLSLIFWGISFILIGDMTLKIGWLTTNLLMTFSSLVFLTILTLYKERNLLVANSSAYKLAALIGIFSTMGYVGYSLGVNSVYASIVAPVVAAAPTVTVVLALIFLKEKLVREQKIGIFLLVLGLVSLAV
jgi:uncharacterized membrane protein